MLSSAIILFIAIIGASLWLAAIIGFGVITAPLLHKQLPAGQAGEVASRIIDRAHLVGWYGGIVSLIAIILHSLMVSEGPVDPAFLLWTIPLILATSLWWVSWRKILPKAEALRLAISVVDHSSEEENDEIIEARRLFDDIHHLSVNLWKACFLLIIIGMAGLSWLST